MRFYKVKELSEMTKTTVRTLQHYDEIGLLKPSLRSDSDYRLYSDKEVLKLQQIITLKYLGLSLKKIKEVFAQPNFDLLKSLNFQAEALMDQASKITEASRVLSYIASQISAGQKINWTSTSVIINLLEKNMTQTNQPSQSELGQKTSYDQAYNPGRLFPIPRAVKRQEIGIDPMKLPFHGFDIWNHYEVSWLNPKGKPMVALAEIILPCESPNIIESKSMKLYFNSLNHSKFESLEKLQEIISKDLSEAAGAPVQIKLKKLSDDKAQAKFDGENIDDLDITCSAYLVDPSFLKTSETIIEETLCSDLLKSNCLVTNQPDWGSVQIHYKGPKINKEGLLKYIVSFRNHNEFHEQCIERIFIDILTHCQPQELTVYGRYTRRGGLDINPYRSTKSVSAHDLNTRLVRQ